MKEKDPEKYKAYLDAQKEKSRQRRLSIKKDTTKLEHERVMARERQRKRRAKKQCNIQKLKVTVKGKHINFDTLISKVQMVIKHSLFFEF